MDRDLTGLKTDGIVFAHGSAEMTMRIGETFLLAGVRSCFQDEISMRAYVFIALLDLKFFFKKRKISRVLTNFQRNGSVHSFPFFGETLNKPINAKKNLNINYQ